MKNFKKALAFTLAEVLITLSILGVVAAITVPSLIKRQHRNEVETKIRKFVSTMENVIDTSQAENGPARTWRVTSVPDGSSVSHELLKKYIFPYMNITQDNFGKDPLWTVTNPDGSVTWATEASQFCLKDGTCFSGGFEQKNSNDINGEPGRYESSESNRYDLMNIRVDLNGPKGPNMFGKDVFFFRILEVGKSGTSSFQVYGLYQFRKEINSSYKQGCKNGDAIGNCTRWIAENGWKIPKDYPWL